MTGGESDHQVETPQKQLQSHIFVDDEGSDTHSPGREEALTVAGAKARKQQEGAAASRARRAAKRRQQREFDAFRTPPRGVDASVESPESVGSDGPPYANELEVSMELFPASNATAAGGEDASPEPAKSTRTREPGTWVKRLCRWVCRCCCRKADRMQNNHAGSYGVAPQQESGRPEHDSMVAIPGEDVRPDRHPKTEKRYFPFPSHFLILKRQVVVPQDDTGTEQHDDEEEAHRLLPTDLNASMDAASDATEERLSWQPSPGGAISTPPGGGSAAGKSAPEMTPNVDDDLQPNLSVSAPATPESSLLSENPQLSSSPDGPASNLVHDTVLVSSGSPPSALEEDSFPAKTRWERAVRKAEAVAAFVRGNDSEAETHWRLSADDEDVVAREYAEDFDQKDAELHPSQRRVVVNIRSLSASTSPNRRAADDEDPSEGEELQTAAEHLAETRRAQQSDR